jgi:hypothetical protein
LSREPWPERWKATCVSWVVLLVAALAALWRSKHAVVRMLRCWRLVAEYVA